MKSVRTLAILVILTLTLGAEAAPKDTLRILAVGNSFSMDALDHNFHSIAAADGRCAIVGNLYIGGCSLERHYQNCQTDAHAYSYYKINEYGVRTMTPDMSISRALSDEKWDVITFQQASHYSGRSETYEPYLSSLILYVRGRIPNALIYFHQTWAYAATSGHQAFSYYERSQRYMYDQIVFASGKAVREHQLGIIPAGTAIQNLRQTEIGDKLNAPDGYHLNELGRYAAACTWYETLFGRSSVGNTFRPQGIDEEKLKAAQKAAHKAVKRPYKSPERIQLLSRLFASCPDRDAQTSRVPVLAVNEKVSTQFQRCPQRPSR